MTSFLCSDTFHAIICALSEKAPNNHLLTSLRDEARIVWRGAHMPDSEQTEIDYLDISSEKPEFISYVILKKRPEDIWDAKKRFHGKPARTIAKLGTFTQTDLEEFATLYFAHQTKTADLYTFKIVEGEELRRYYHEKTYPEGVDLNSCMRYNCTQKYLDIYTENPKQVKLAILLNASGELVSRSLIWYGLSINGTQSAAPCHDRIYFMDGETLCAMKKYLTPYQNIFNSPDSLSIEFDNYNHDYWPYIDTLYYSDDSGLFNNQSGEYVYRETDGQREGGNSREYCAACGCEVYEDDAIYVDGEGTCCCDCCTFVSDRDETYLNRYVRTLQDGTVAHRDDCTEINGEYYLDSDLTETSDGDMVLESESVYTEDGSTWHQDQEGDTFIRIEDRGYFDIDSSDLTKTHDGTLIHVDEAVIYDGTTYHQSECLTTCDGDTFPEHLHPLFVYINGLPYTSQLKLAYAS